MKIIVFISYFFGLNLWAMPADSSRSVIIKRGLNASYPQMNRKTSLHSKKNATEAFLWSAGHTVLPVVAGGYILNKLDTYETAGSFAVGYGFLIGPSMGNFYAQDFGRGLLGVGIRTAGTALFYSGVADALQDDWFDDEGNDSRGDGGAKITGGFIIYTIGALYSIFTLPQSVHDYNKKFELSASPSYDPKSRTLALHAQLVF